MARGTPQKTTPKKAAASALEEAARDVVSPALDVNQPLMARVEEALDSISKVTVAVTAEDPQCFPRRLLA